MGTVQDPFPLIVGMGLSAIPGIPMAFNAMKKLWTKRGSFSPYASATNFRESLTNLKSPFNKRGMLGRFDTIKSAFHGVPELFESIGASKWKTHIILPPRNVNVSKKLV